MGMRRGLVIGAVGTACALLLGGAACQPPPATPLCGQGRGGQPGSLLSADHDHVAYLSDSTALGTDLNSTACDVFVRTLSTGQIRRVSSEPTAAGRPIAISADGRLVLYPIAGAGKLVDVESGEVLWSHLIPRPRAVDLTPDGRYLAWADGLDLVRLDRTTGDLARVASGAVDPLGGTESINGISISDSGSVVAVAAFSGLYSWDVAAGTTQQHDANRSRQAEVSPDGAMIARLREDEVEPAVGTVSSTERSTGAVTAIPASGDLGSMAWSLEGSWLVFVSANQTLAGDLTGLDPRDLAAQNVYALRLRDHRVVRLFRPGFLGWPAGPTINAVFSATERNALNSPQDRRFEVVALEP